MALDAKLGQFVFINIVDEDTESVITSSGRVVGKGLAAADAQTTQVLVEGTSASPVTVPNAQVYSTQAAALAARAALIPS